MKILDVFQENVFLDVLKGTTMSYEALIKLS